MLTRDLTNQADLVEHDNVIIMIYNNNDSFQSLESFCGLANGLVTMTFSIFLVVIDIY